MSDFFGQEAGQQRRAWLDRQEARFQDTMQRFLGPTGIPGRLNALAQVAPMVMDGSDYMDARQASGNMLTDPSFTNALAMTAPMVALALPGISNRLAEGAADFAGDAGRFAMDEFGGLSLSPRGGYAGTHTAPNLEPGVTLDNPADIFGDDIYGRQALQYFGSGDRAADSASLKAIQGMRGKPDAETMIYRAVPKSAGDDINAGDWVTTSKAYAVGHGKSALDGDYKIIAEKVRAGELATDGNSLNEWGWWPDDARKVGRNR
jgi:hypothetical protein